MDRGKHDVCRDTMSSKRPTILFFNINGTGLGHLSTCLAYAHRLREHARPVFFSLAAAVEKIHDMGFEADYFVSPAWSRAANRHWNRQLALRVGLMLERVRPDMLVFDGTWPFHGLLHAATAHGVRRLVWSNLVLYKDGMRPVPVSENRFDLVIRLGEIGTRFMVEREERPGRRVVVPPVTLLRDDDLLTRDAARAALGLERGGRYALFSLGPGNLKDIAGIGRGLIDEMKARGFTIVWTRTPITIKDVPLPDDVVPIAVYPLARYMRAFDVYVGAAGYNACCEVLQSGVPALFVPNTLVVDDQTRRAERVAEAVPAVVSPCETASQRADAVSRLMELAGRQASSRPPLDGAERAAEEILALL
ncbi:MAG: glycosyl transferase [Gammaproteobacteria bacterium]